MILKKITYGYDPLLARLDELYVTSFPAVARVATERLRQLIGLPGCEMTFYAIVEREQMRGMATIWELGSARYLAYLATFAEARNHGLGAAALAELLAQSPLPIVGEVEPPESALQQRRIAFYERNGFHVAMTDPAILNGYHKGNDLYLIASQPIADCEAMQRLVIEKVYRVLHEGE